MKKIILISAIALSLFTNVKAQNSFYRATALDTAGSLVNKGFTQIRAINLVNLSTTVLYVKMYNLYAQPNRMVDKPVITLQLQSNALAKTDLSSMIGVKFPKGLWLRCSTSAVDTANTQPSTKPIVEIGY